MSRKRRDDDLEKMGGRHSDGMAKRLAAAI
jgi:hypothetical protein